LGEYDPAIVVTSLEPKAIETGQIVADRLGKPLVCAPDLHEHERGRVNLFPSREAFEARLADLFACPRSLVFGSETADQARARFAKAVADVTARYPGGDLIVVSHGTVIALFVAHVAGLEPFPFWKRLGLPCFVVLSLPGLDLLEVIERLDDSLA
jgi:broad specificity phosphatase PhoE